VPDDRENTPPGKFNIYSIVIDEDNYRSFCTAVGLKFIAYIQLPSVAQGYKIAFLPVAKEKTSASLISLKLNLFPVLVFPR
jgi:hypothetical protein